MRISVLFIGEDPFIFKPGGNYQEYKDFISFFRAKNVTDAIKLLNNESFDLIVSDSYLSENEYPKLIRSSGNGGRGIPFLFFDRDAGRTAAECVLDAAYGLYLRKFSSIKSGSQKRVPERVKTTPEGTESERVISGAKGNYAGLCKMMRLMCDNVPDLIWAKDIDKRYLFANKAMCDILLNASDTSEPVGKTDLYFAERERALHPDDPNWHTFGEICLKSDEITMQANKPCRFDEYGNVGGEFLFLDVHKAPFLNEDGEMIGTVGSARDVTEQKRAEEELVKSEERLRLTLEATNDGIWDWDIKSGDEILSQRWYTMLGYEPGEFKGSFEAWKALIHPDDIESVEWTVLSHLEKCTDYSNLEFRMKTKSGNWKWIHSRGCVVERDEFGRPARMVGTHTDIDERKKTEIALKESEHKFRTLVDRASEMLFLHDLNGDIVDVNIKAVRRTGYTRDELLSMNVVDIDPDSELRDDFNLIWHERPLYEDVIFEARHCSKDGSIYPAEVHAVKLLIAGRPFVLALATDITERKAAENALRESEQKYRDTFENSVAGLFKTSPDGRIIEANDSFAGMYGYTDAAELIADNVNSCELYVSMSERTELLKALEVKGEVGNFELQQVKRDGTPFWVSVNGRVIHDFGGNILYYEGSLIDITNKKQAEEALKLANRKLQILSAITRHDILNHVTVIRGILALTEDMADGPEKTEYVKELENSAILIEENIVFSREYEKLGIDEPCWICLSDIIRKLRCRNIIITDKCMNFMIYADPMLEKVFANLLDNTIRHGEGATRIKISCNIGEENCGLNIIWEDDGAGIPVSEKEKIFGRGVGRNTGFGLFLSREILSITGIEITETGTEGFGARFELHVPPGVWKREPEVSTAENLK